MRDWSNHTPISTRRLVSAMFLMIGISGCESSVDGGNPISQVPVANNSCAYASGVNQSFNGTLSATDPNGQSLTYSIVGAPSNGTANLINPFTGAFVYNPNTNTRGTDEFTFRACKPSPSTLCSNVATYKVVHTPRIMPLGDSITQGVTSSNNPPNAQRIGYRKPLLDSLTSAGYQIDFVGTLSNGSGATPPLTDPEHEGHGGCTAADFINGTGTNGCAGSGSLATWMNSAQPDVVLLHIGTNELGNGADPNMVWSDVESILTVINNWESGRWPVTVIMSRIINTSPTTAAWTTYNTNVINLVYTPHKASNDQVIWVNHEAALASSSDYGDSIHPSTAGYQKMANTWLFPLAGTGTPSGSHTGASILPKCP